MRSNYSREERQKIVEEYIQSYHFPLSPLFENFTFLTFLFTIVKEK